MSITTTCGSGIIRCWRRRHWRNVCGKWRNCFRRMRDLSSRFCTSGGANVARVLLPAKSNQEQFPNFKKPGRLKLLSNCRQLAGKACPEVVEGTARPTQANLFISEHEIHR